MNMDEPGKAQYLIAPNASRGADGAVVDQVASTAASLSSRRGRGPFPPRTRTPTCPSPGSTTRLRTAPTSWCKTRATPTATNKYASNSPVAGGTLSDFVQFTTLDGSPPVFEGGPAPPAVSDVDSTSFSLDVQLDEVGKAYYLVVKRTTDSSPRHDAGAGSRRLLLGHRGVRSRGRLRREDHRQQDHRGHGE